VRTRNNGGREESHENRRRGALVHHVSALP
jgi:hypothetical protein